MQITESDAWYISPRTIVNFTHTKSTHQVQVQPKKFVRNFTKKNLLKLQGNRISLFSLKAENGVSKGLVLTCAMAMV